MEYGDQDMKDATLVRFHLVVTSWTKLMLIKIWGKGPRACLGQTMMMINISITAARLLTRFEVRLASEQTRDDMLHTDHLVIVAKGMKCMIVFDDIPKRLNSREVAWQFACCRCVDYSRMQPSDEQSILFAVLSDGNWSQPAAISS